MKKLLLIYIGFGVLIFANSKFQDWTLGYGVFNILDVSNISVSLKNWFELLFIVPILLFVLFNLFKNNLNLNKKNLSLLFILLIISTLSLFIFTDNYGAGIRTVLRYLSPIIYFLMFSLIKFEEKEIKYFLIILSIIFYVLIFIGLYQWLILGYTIDHLHSLVDNAHIYALLMLYGVMYYFTKYIVYKRIKYLLYMMPPLILALVASNDKATIIFLPTILIAYIIYSNIKFKTLVRATIVFIISIVFALFVFTRMSDELRQNLAGGLDRLITGLESLPITEIIQNTAQYKSYKSIPDIYLSNVYPILLGVGPTNFGSIEVNQKSEFSQLTFAQEDYYLLQTDIFRFGSSDVLVLLIEFGLLFSIVYLLFIIKILKVSLYFTKIDNDPFIKHLLLWMFCYLIMLITISFLSYREGLSYFSNTIPYFTLIGMINSLLLKKSLPQKYLRDVNRIVTIRNNQ